MGARDNRVARATVGETINLTGMSAEFGLPGDVAEALGSFATISIGTTDGRGTTELREAIAAAFAVEKGVALDPDRIIMTIGAKEATVATMMALLEPGDEVLLSDPAWVSYEPWIRRAGALPVRFGMRRQGGFRPDPDEICGAVNPRTRLLILTSPHNPTGTVMRRDEYEALDIALGRYRNVLIVSDESNSRIVFDGVKHVSPLEIGPLAERTILFRSFSKDYAVPGWRIGYIHAERPHVDAIRAAHEHAVSCVPALIQHAALSMLRSPATTAHISRFVEALTERRRILVEGLDAMPGVSCHRPEGAFNAFPHFSEAVAVNEITAQRLFDQAGLITVPGSAFGALGAGHIRMAFTQPPSVLQAVLSRVQSLCALAMRS